MIETEKTYEFEVAFSFLQQDEGIANEINDLIQDRFNTFLYSIRQKELAGTDGEKTFNAVFSEKSRIVIILYREEWGTTSWTRIEETAIRNRAHNEGYDFTTFVRLDPISKMPSWLPKNRIYYNFDRWGTKGLAPVIEARIQEAGGLIRSDSIEDRAARMKRKVLNQKERQVFLNSRGIFDKAQGEFDNLYRSLELKTKLLEDKEMNLLFGYETQIGKVFTVHCEGYKLRFWWQHSDNSSLPLSYTCLDINLTIDSSNKTMAFVERGMFGSANQTSLKNERLTFDYNPSTKECGWSVIDSSDGEFLTSEKIMDSWLKLFLEKVFTVKIEKQSIIR